MDGEPSTSGGKQVFLVACNFDFFFGNGEEIIVQF